ncbi:ATP-binding protein [Pseudonocardia sp. KRD-182]|uniref:ATP-binding protein n=1 Tax=Pseudonocardia oceani TaxID=2792013 RepID=UPI001C4A3B58|nr:ATP-binding protein [Pseudonocardia oceani]MBW0108418.1 ATP-binding protein [Pseudonocardia oceani]
MRLVAHTGPGGVRVELRGTVAADGDGELSIVLAVLLQEHGCVVADLGRLGGVGPDTVTGLVLVLVDAVDAGGGWPAARLVVSCPDAELRATLAATPALTGIVLAATIEQARIRCGERPHRLSAQWTVDDGPSSLARARHVVAARAREWSDGGRGWDVDDVVMVANELLTNALEHARSRAVLRLTLDGDVLEVAVRDSSPRPPDLRAHDVRAPRGRGLQVVQALSDRWGWMPHDDGKVVWARPSGARTA